MADCVDIRKKLVNHHLGLLEEKERMEVDAHLTTCPECLKAFEAIGSDFDAFRKWGDCDPPLDVLDEILDRAREAASSRASDHRPLQPPVDHTPASAGAQGPPRQRVRTGSVDLDDLLGDGSLDNLEKDLEELENLVASKRASGTGSEVDLASVDVYSKRATPGKLSKDEREKLLKELGLDEDSPLNAGENAETEGAPALEDMARLADQAAKLKTRRGRRSSDDWEKLCGTTVFGQGELPAPETKESDKAARGTDEWLALSGTASFVPPMREKDAKADTLFGTTILPTAGIPKAPTRRFASRMLAEIKTEDVKKRARKRKVRKASLRSVPVMVAVGVHAAVALILGFMVFTNLIPDRIKGIDMNLKDQIPDKKKEIDEEEEIEEKENVDILKENVDDDMEETDEALPDNQQVHQKELIQIDNPNKSPEIRQKGNVDVIRRQSGSRGGGGRWKAVELGLQWLERHQDRDGKWDWTGYTRHCRQGICDCPHCVRPELHGVPRSVFEKDPSALSHAKNFNVGLTGLALLCFLGSGYTHTDLPESERAEASKVFLERHAHYMEPVRKAVQYLTKVLTPDGCFTPSGRLDTQAEGYMYNQGICTLALLEAFQLAGDPALEEPARRAIGFICRAQSPRQGGWDYLSFDRPEGKDSRRCDVSVSSWQVMALKSAVDAGLDVDPDVWNRARRYFRVMTSRDGSLRYASGKRGEGLRLVNDDHYKRDSIGVCAAGVLSKMYLGAPLESYGIKRGADLIIRDLPDPNKITAPKPKDDEFNFHTIYYWYYGTLVMFHLGEEYWDIWKDYLVDMLKRTQNKGNAKGSWDPKGEFLGTYAGRLYVTVFNILNLEVFYRYLPLYRTREISTKVPEKRLKSLKELVRDAKGKKRKVQVDALRELGKRFGEKKEALDAFASILLDPRHRFTARNTAYRALKKSGKPCLPYFRTAFLQVDDKFKLLIMVAFRDLEDLKAIPLLENIAGSPDASKAVRRQAVQLLQTLK